MRLGVYISRNTDTLRVVTKDKVGRITNWNLTRYREDSLTPHNPEQEDILKNRAAVKALSRERDEDRLRRGEVSPSELQRENLVFRGFRKDVIGLKPKYKPKSVDFVLA